MTEVARPTAAALSVEVRKIAPTEADATAAVLARAFDDDPFVNWLVAQDAKRSSRMASLFDTSVKKMALPHNEVYSTPECHGAAVWFPPEKWKLGMLQQFMLMPRMIKAASLRRLPAVSGGLNALDKKHPHTPHYYLMMLGVEPDLRGRSVGTQLMAPVLARCDAEGVPAYLENSKEQNTPLYERNGFKVMEEFQVPSGGPKIWLMWRDPQ